MECGLIYVQRIFSCHVPAIQYFPRVEKSKILDRITLAGEDASSEVNLRQPTCNVCISNYVVYTVLILIQLYEHSKAANMTNVDCDAQWVNSGTTTRQFWLHPGEYYCETFVCVPSFVAVRPALLIKYLNIKKRLYNGN